MLVFWGYQLYLEVIQYKQGAKNKKIIEEFEFYNLNDLVHLFLIGFLGFCHLRDPLYLTQHAQVIMAATASFSLGVKLYDWLRLF